MAPATADSPSAVFQRDPRVVVGLIIEITKSGTDASDRGGTLLGVCRLRDLMPAIPADQWCCDCYCWVTCDARGNWMDSVAGLSPMDNFSGKSDYALSHGSILNEHHRVRRGTMRLHRMVQYMRERGITPLIWDGEKAVPV